MQDLDHSFHSPEYKPPISHHDPIPPPISFQTCAHFFLFSQKTALDIDIDIDLHRMSYTGCLTQDVLHRMSYIGCLTYYKLFVACSPAAGAFFSAKKASLDFEQGIIS